MTSWISNERVIWLGWLAFPLFVAGLVGFTIIDIVVAMSDTILPAYIKPIEGVISFILFVAFLLGIRSFALLKSDSDLRKNVNTLILIGLLEVILLYPYYLPLYFEQNFLTVLLIASLPIICINGIALTHIARSFVKYIPELGSRAKQIVWWNRTAGWMFASIILIIPAFIPAFIGEFFLWRFLAEQRKATASSPQPFSTIPQEAL